MEYIPVFRPEDLKKYEIHLIEPGGMSEDDNR